MVLGEYLFTGINGILFKVNLEAIILSAILGFITIYLSAFISAKKASKVNPIKLLRNADDVKIKAKKLKTPKIVKKLFKTGGVLAYKNLKRSKKKYRTTVISIAVSICIFITMSAFINNMFDFSSGYYKDYGYNMKVYCRGEGDKDYTKEILALEDIEEYTAEYNTKNHEDIKITDFSKVVRNDNYVTDEELKDMKYMNLTIIGLEDKAFKEYAKKAGVKYEEAKKNGILNDNYTTYLNGNEMPGRVYNYQEGDTISGTYNEKEFKIKVSKITEVVPKGAENYYYFGGYIVVDIQEHKDLEFELYSLAIESSNPDRLEENIKKISSDVSVRNISAEVKEERAMITVIKIFLYGFIAVITLIGVTNIFNTITSNMELRQKEFAMLKSIGMTRKEFDRMINLETIFYGTKSLAYGVILGILGTLLLYQGFDIKMKELYFPTGPILISFVSVFILIFIIMRYSLNKINKQNTIETIRKDNI